MRASRPHLALRLTAWTLRWLIYLTPIVAACWLSAIYLSAGRKERPQPDWMFWYALHFAGWTALVWVVSVPWVIRRFDPVLGAGALANFVLSMLVWWNQAYLLFWPVAPYQREVFRKALQRPSTPVYGEAAVFNPYEVYLAIGLLVVLVAVGYAFVSGRLRVWISWTLLVVACAFAALSLARIETRLDGRRTYTGERFYGNTTSHKGFVQDLVDFKGPRDILQHYVERMPGLGWFGRHYPPGYLMLYRVQEGLRDNSTSVRQSWARYERRKEQNDDPDVTVGQPNLPPQGFVTGVSLACALGSLPVFYLLARELRVGKRGARLAVVLVAIGAGAIVFPTVSPMSLLLLPTALMWWSFARALRTGAWPLAALCGASVYAFGFFSFGVTVVGLVMTLALIGLLLTRAVHWKRALYVCGVSAGTGLLVYALMRLATGFDLIACMREAVLGHEAQQESDPFRPAYMWWLRSSGNLLAYAFSAAVALGATVSALLRGPRLNITGVWLIAGVLTILVSSFGGLFWLETERIWIFFTPLLAIGAAHASRNERQAQFGLILFATALLLTWEVAFIPWL